MNEPKKENTYWEAQRIHTTSSGKQFIICLTRKPCFEALPKPNIQQKQLVCWVERSRHLNPLRNTSLRYVTITGQGRLATCTVNSTIVSGTLSPSQICTKPVPSPLAVSCSTLRTQTPSGKTALILEHIYHFSWLNKKYCLINKSYYLSRHTWEILTALTRRRCDMTDCSSSL